MTIFDVLRYPLSNPPTGEELAALPASIQEYLNTSTEWNLLVWHANYLSACYNEISSIYYPTTQGQGSIKYNEIMAGIRKRLIEYDNI